MLITIINQSGVSTLELKKAVAAINKQVIEFGKHWDTNARCTIGPNGQADAIVYLQKTIDVSNALGYHDEVNATGKPYAVVATQVSEQLGESWTVTLSHEILELLADPEANIYSIGPKPSDPSKNVFFWYEVCDPVQSEIYVIDGIKVSNFVFPLYFTTRNESNKYNDYMRAVGKIKTELQSFGISAGGYVGYYDPELQQDQTVFADKKAKLRFKIKNKYKVSRAAKYKVKNK